MMLPPGADQVKAFEKLPVPDTVAEQLVFFPCPSELTLHVTVTPVIESAPIAIVKLAVLVEFWSEVAVTWAAPLAGAVLGAV